MTSFALLLLLGFLPGRAAPMLTLSPDASPLTGAPGSTVGWGFTLTNTSDFLVVTGVSFVPTPLSSFGTFQDLLSTRPDLVVVGPSPESTSLSESFNLGVGTGIGAFHIAPTAAGSVSGDIVLNYSLFSMDPNDPNFDPGSVIVPDGSLSARASVSVASGVPEPGPWGLVMVGIGLVAVRLKGSRRATSPDTGSKTHWYLS